jgi:hypothetical protein
MTFINTHTHALTGEEKKGDNNWKEKKNGLKK